LLLTEILSNIKPAFSSCNNGIYRTKQNLKKAIGHFSPLALVSYGLKSLFEVVNMHGELPEKGSIRLKNIHDLALVSS
jgi:hypothetical protein